MKLSIGRRLLTVHDLDDAQTAYCRSRDLSGEGASTFRPGRVFASAKPMIQIATISYNGRCWDMAGNPIEGAVADERELIGVANAARDVSP